MVFSFSSGKRILFPKNLLESNKKKKKKSLWYLLQLSRNDLPSCVLPNVYCENYLDANEKWKKTLLPKLISK